MRHFFKLAMVVGLGALAGCGGKPAAPAATVPSTASGEAAAQAPSQQQVAAAAELEKQQKAIADERAALALEHAAFQAKQKREIDRLSRAAEIKRLQQVRSFESSERSKNASDAELAKIVDNLKKQLRDDQIRLGSLGDDEIKKTEAIFAKFFSGDEMTAEEEEVLLQYNSFRDIVISLRKTHPSDPR